MSKGMVSAPGSSDLAKAGTIEAVSRQAANTTETSNLFLNRHISSSFLRKRVILAEME
jgi:hypothetical protein